MPRDKGLTRRQFIKAAGAAGLGSLLTAAPPLWDGKARAAGMPMRKFGKTGAMVPILSMGMMYDTIANQLLLRQALALGVTHWDTAYSYMNGNSEVGLGKFFARRPQARKRIFLVTKGFSRDPKVMEQKLNLSLRKLHTNYVDLYYMHGVSDPGGDIPKEVVAWGERQKAAGRIKSFGFSTHSSMAACLEQAAKAGWADAVMFTYNYRLLHDKKMQRALDSAAKAGIALTAMKTQGSRSYFSSGGGSADIGLTKKFVSQGYSVEQAKLKVVWEDERISTLCSQMPELGILKANVAAAMNQTKLSQAGKKALVEHDQLTKDCYCAGCADICEGALGGAFPVATVMRGLMYHNSYGETGWTRELFASLDMNAAAGLDLAAAEAACPRGMPIARLVRGARSLQA